MEELCKMSLLKEIEPIKTKDFLQEKFREYYKSAKITVPPRFTAREWGFLNWGGGVMNRHVRFGTMEELNNYLKKIAPAHSYHSVAYYKEPGSKTMVEKQWQGADLIFDLDADHLPEMEDVTFTGSMASYNYHNLSDIDLHLRLDFRKITDSRELIEKLFTEKRIRWNNDHKIIIFGHEVEIYIEDTNEEHFANGIYSVLRREWIEMPTKQQVDIDFEATKKKYNAISKEVDQLSGMFEDKKYKEVYSYTKILKDKIKRMRQSGLEDEGVFSSENLAFKMLRINGELATLSGLRLSAYDSMKSLDNKSATKVNISELWKQFKESRP